MKSLDIYIVQPDDDIRSIAKKFNTTAEKLISDNGLLNPYHLVVGQTIVILNPKETYIVKQGDTLAAIADSNDISITDLVRNNPFLCDRNYIYPGEILVITYNTVKDIQVNGYTFSFLNMEVLRKALPYLTYISILNYRITEHADIISYSDDTEIIKMSKESDTIPLLMISAFSPTGDLNIEQVYELLLTEELQDKLEVRTISWTA